MNSFLAVFIGGGLGSIARYSLSIYIKNLNWVELPIATFGANMISTMFLGLTFFYLKANAPQWVYALLAIGFCGGFSTFSTFSLETFQMMKSGQIAWAIGNVLVSVTLSLFILFFLSKTLK